MLIFSIAYLVISVGFFFFIRGQVLQPKIAENKINITGSIPDNAIVIGDGNVIANVLGDDKVLTETNFVPLALSNPLSTVERSLLIAPETIVPNSPHTTSEVLLDKVLPKEPTTQIQLNWIFGQQNSV